MKILAVDAATEACSVALYNDGEISSIFEICPQQHSQKLLPFIEKILSDSGIKLDQLDGIAYGQGPGSFTGVRIGVSVTQGLAFGADLPVVGVSNLAIMAQQAIEQHDAESIVAAIDARMSEIYLGCYKNVNGFAQLINNEIAIKPELLRKEDFDLNNSVSVGTGWTSYNQLLTSSFDVKVTDIELPNAKYMLPLALDAFNKGLSVTAEFAQPNYVRDEVSWKKLPGR
ncbi:tRNA (adenosine(37)-N6)-threonylcarbamoyltransferase complex dimerization subunit type 1 TsaB [Psychrosphaera saromensis]|uniref:tRNA threonylcarbamoyladenosine biosynthesis protein TsaB n=1 Tax=Psychrosphaera saromensis TaxID=716813 RepID=A0A2S7UV98_9GAMM|nr:tRNA (adenosine(37)-N6)-threonylcarbamoyltransferase complex dimerization subunit type 1 TsaB [Psychrosphaera saromensis]PQJ53645.1 tRNA (adenosine(37)-N6)-threonylcarbamoyltransferase complex dimerization subunit type 1 TsaB [Psychrosphaera saromensis]GHB63555.1 tRNA (adenosine(37)-N6)-threonylcarbamoyltransferase complex dimerization subunit type 1 TsaB [Psychrosphaera saromensis]GLQ15586.1 tRNA (adenosine(37)-N6)-threonylcarbamoyltransferase complex dimerization subunit type 1 TsaB [Psychr